jgi:hypothetical protein
LVQAKEDYQKQQQRDAVPLTPEQQAKIRALASDFPRLWQDPKTPDRDRKRMARLLLEDVTLRRGEDLQVQIRFRGGALKELHLPLPKPAWELKKTKPEIVAAIDQLLDEHSEGQIAHLLNQRGWHSSGACPFTLRIVNALRRAYRLKSRFDRLRERGLLTTAEVATIIGSRLSRVKYWRQVGVLTGLRFSEKNEYIYDPPTPAMMELIHERRCKRRGVSLGVSSPRRGAV